MRWNLIVFISLVLLVLVIPHIVSADTLLVYLSEDTADECLREGTDQSWTNLRNDVGDASVDGSVVSINCPEEMSTSTSNVWSRFGRFGYGFNTSQVPDTAIISSAVFGFQPASLYSTCSNQDFGITGFSPAIVNDFSAGDYDSFSSTRYASDIAYASLVTLQYNNFTFNSDGLSAISKTGYTNFMLRLKSDIDNSAPSWGSSCVDGAKIYDYNENSGRQPFLEIVYSSGVSAPVAAFTADHTSVCQQDPIQFTDQSTNTPTGWYWDFGDTSTNTTQNPVYRYSTNGLFTVKLQATNEFGFDWENKTNYIGVGDWGECVDQGETCQA